MGFLTSQEVTRNGLDVLHEKLNFISTINQQYDERFAVAGAKIGQQLQIKLPNEYSVRTGSDWDGQETNESSVLLTVATIKGVDSFISDVDLTMSMNDFREQVLEPQMAVLASIIENDALDMTLDVANAVGTPGTIPGSTANQALMPWLQAKQRLSENLAPGPYVAQINGDASTYTINGMTGLFNDQRTLAKQFAEGFLLRNSGLDYYEQNKIKRLILGTVVTATGATVNGDNQGEAGTVILASCGNGGTVKAGTIVQFADVNDIHPETKQSYGRLKQFVVTADATADGAGAATISISPTIVTSDAKQNVDAAIVTGAAVTIVGTASTGYAQNLVYNKNAFAFVAANLETPKGMDMAYQTKGDGKIPLRFVRWWDGDTGKWKSRFDVLYGYKTIRQQLACRIWGA